MCGKAPSSDQDNPKASMSGFHFLCKGQGRNKQHSSKKKERQLKLNVHVQHFNQAKTNRTLNQVISDLEKESKEPKSLYTTLNSSVWLTH